MTLFRKLIFIFIPLFCALHPAVAQQVLSGKVSDSRTTLPLSAVSVSITDLQVVTVSGENGLYRFDHLPKTVVHVSFSSLGYKTLVKTVNLESDSSLDVGLEPSSMELQEVLVTSNNSQLTDRIPFSANSISQVDLRKYSSPSVMGNLSYQPGVDKITIGNGIGKPVIRGLSFNQVLLYSQGTRIENQQWDDHHDLGLSDVGMENVEVVRGPAALIYGADALGGALVFRDEKPAPAGTAVSKANFGFGSNTLGFSGDYGWKRTNKDGLFYGFTLGGTSQTSYLQGEHVGESKAGDEEEDFAFNSKFLNGIGKANIGLNRNWGTSRLSYSYFKQQIGIIEDESTDTSLNFAAEKNEQRDREVEAPYQDVTSQVVSLENTFVTGISKVNVNLAYQVNDRKEYEPLPQKQKELAIGLLLHAITYDVKWTGNAEKPFGITLGSQGTFLKNKNNGLESLVPDADVSDLAAYGLFRYDQGNLNLLGGVRMDSRHMEVESYERYAGQESDTFILQSSGDTLAEPESDFEKKFTPLSFSLGATYKAGRHLLVKLNGATGFTAPNYAQLTTFGKHEGAYRFERGHAGLDVEQNLEGDLGLAWENESVTLNLSGYLNRVNDYIYLANTGDSMIRITPSVTDTLALYDYKQGDAEISGFEAGFDFHPRNAAWFSIGATYSHTRGSLVDGGNLPYIPSDKLVAEMKLKKEKLIGFQKTYCSVVVSTYSKQEHVADFELSTDGYSLLDVHVGGSFKLGKQMTQFDLFCTNVLNTGYYNQLSLIKNIGVQDMGRNIGVSFHIPITNKNNN
jgi:iron complex outermembrane receptor protein